MNLTLLFDLDDTLLGNDIDTFLPAYLQALSAHMAACAEPRRLVKTLMYASSKMVENLHPDRTLEEVFDADFYPPLGIEKEQVRGTLETFYAEEFPKLRRLTQPIPGAVDVVKTVLGRGYRVAIATNPLFPRAAVLHRLEWAGLPVDEFPFALVPSFHAFHFSKPNPSFYSELLGKLAWPEGPVVMVGDSFTNDISPAMQAGLATYWVTGGETTAPEHQPAPTGRGALASLFPWLDATPAERLLPNYSSPAAILATLRATPAFFHCLGTNLSREAWVRRPSPGEWSAIEILCHLVDMDAEVNLPRMHKIVNDKNPFLAGMDTDAWAEARQYIQRDGLQAFSDYVTQRQGLVAYLESLPAEAWQRKARHAIFGPTSLREIASFAASHDRLHVRQIFQTLPTYECI